MACLLSQYSTAASVSTLKFLMDVQQAGVPVRTQGALAHMVPIGEGGVREIVGWDSWFLRQASGLTVPLCLH